MNTPQRGLLKRQGTPMAQQAPTVPAGSGCEGDVATTANELMNARTAIHKLHLKITGPGSYSAHKALNELYDALPDHADTLVEQYQGAAETLITIPDSCPRTLNTKEEGIQYMRELKIMVTNLQAKLPYSEIINDLDIVKSTLNSIKYKLMFLS